MDPMGYISDLGRILGTSPTETVWDLMFLFTADVPVVAIRLCFETTSLGRNCTLSVLFCHDNLGSVEHILHSGTCAKQSSLGTKIVEGHTDIMHSLGLTSYW